MRFPSFFVFFLLFFVVQFFFSFVSGLFFVKAGQLQLGCRFFQIVAVKFVSYPPPRPWHSSDLVGVWCNFSARSIATVIRSSHSHERSRLCRLRADAVTLSTFMSTASSQRQHTKKWALFRENGLCCPCCCFGDDLMCARPLHNGQCIAQSLRLIYMGQCLRTGPPSSPLRAT